MKRRLETPQDCIWVTTAREIALAFGGSGAPSEVPLPAHDDPTASCGVKDSGEAKIAVKCHAGCEREARRA
jgi:hypothetical protein